MAEDAEWIDVDTEFGIPGSKVPPPRPFPPDRPRTTPDPPVRRTTKPPRIPRPPPKAPRPGPQGPHDASDRMPPQGTPGSNTLSSVGVIAISLVSCLVIVALVLALFYFLVLKKKLHKVQKPPPIRKRDDYSIRIEDVAHIDIDENEPVYMNTTDIQKLVSTVRSNKNGKSRPPIPDQTNFPDVVQVVQPAMSIPVDNSPPKVFPKNMNTPSVPTITKPNSPPPAIPDQVLKTVEQPTTDPVVTRKAPPPPAGKKDSAKIPKQDKKPILPQLPKPTNHDVTSHSNDNQSSLFDSKWEKKPSPPLIPKPSKNDLIDLQTISPKNGSLGRSTIQKSAPPVLPKPSLNRIDSQEEVLDSRPKSSKPPPPKTASKPFPPTNDTQKPTPPSTLTKPSSVKHGSLKKPILPPLKINQIMKQSSTDSVGIPTPDTTCTYVSGSESEPEPEKMSVKAKRAFLESAMQAADSR